MQTALDTRRPTILIVDDEPVNLHLFSGIFKNEYRVLTASLGQECLDIVALDKPDIILLDVMMPDMDGFEVCSRLKSSERTRDIPIMFVTALGDEDSETKGLKVGAVDYITKPISVPVVRTRVTNQIIVKLQKELIANKQAKLVEDLKAAGAIQQSLLPYKLPADPRSEFAWKFMPCEELGGDILNVVPLGNGLVGMYMADVSGHGPPSAMISFLIYQMMNPYFGILIDTSGTENVVRQPEDVLNVLDKEFPLNRFGKHFTIIYMVVDLATGILTYSNAGHCAPILLRPDGTMERLEESGTVIGIGAFPFGQARVELRQGDRLLLFSDGVFEADNIHEELFGEQRLLEAVRALAASSLPNMVDNLYSAVMNFAEGAPLRDDLSMLAFAYHASEKEDPPRAEVSVGTLRLSIRRG